MTHVSHFCTHSAPQGTYGDIYNFPESEYNKVLDEEGQDMESEAESEVSE